MRYVVTFVVESDDIYDALGQAEAILNSGNRCIDCNVNGPMPEGSDSIHIRATGGAKPRSYVMSVPRTAEHVE